MKCSKCSKELRGGTDTFGSISEPLCQTCNFQELDKPKEPLITYGIKVDEETGQVIHTIKWNEVQ